MILISTGLTTIPTELYESAGIDGANKLQTFWKITVPMLKPTIGSVLILGFIYTFKVFDLVFVMTGGGPVNSTRCCPPTPTSCRLICLNTARERLPLTCCLSFSLLSA